MTTAHHTVVLSTRAGEKLFSWRGPAAERWQAPEKARRALAIAWAAAADARGPCPERFPEGLTETCRKVPSGKKRTRANSGTRWILHERFLALQAPLPGMVLGPGLPRDGYAEQQAVRNAAVDYLALLANPLAEAGWPWEIERNRASWNGSVHQAASDPDIKLDLIGRGRIEGAPGKTQHDLDDACAAGVLALCVRYAVLHSRQGAGRAIAEAGHVAPDSATLRAIWATSRIRALRDGTAPARAWLESIGARDEAQAILARVLQLGTST